MAPGLKMRRMVGAFEKSDHAFVNIIVPYEAKMFAKPVGEKLANDIKKLTHA